MLDNFVAFGNLSVFTPSLIVGKVMKSKITIFQVSAEFV